MDGFIPSPLASTGHRTVVASAGFLRWAMPTEGGIMQGVIHLLQGGHGPGVSSCILSTNRYISGLDRPGWFWPRIPLPTLRLLESQVSQHGVLLDFVGGEPRTLWPVNALSLFGTILIPFLVIVTKYLTIAT